MLAFPRLALERLFATQAQRPASSLGGDHETTPHPAIEGHMLLTAIPALDELLHAHAPELGGDFVAYGNHAYRVVNLCAALSSDDPAQLQKMVIAAAFHDMGIWTDGTFDYLQPSVRLASAHLALSGRAEWTPEITAMILEHHKISRYRGDPHWLAEPFRKADWVDVSRGFLTFGLSRRLLSQVFSRWPSAGFHRRLVQLELKRLRTHPWHPLPMVRL